MSGEPLTIGDVLTRLKAEFDDITISKIRFLESEGLITPRRSESGYRQFEATDVDRLRYVLRAQRDRYLPLRVIKDELARLDAGLPVDASAGGGSASTSPGEASGTPALPGPDDRAGLLTDVALDRGELAHAAGLEAAQVDELIAHGLLPERPPYDGDVLRRARVLAELGRRGLEPRHLRAHRLSADREAAHIEQLVAPLLRQRNPESRRRAASRAEELVELGTRLRALLLEERLGPLTRP
jgi:DNA-binding transcriptional MerR regulator